MRDDTKEALVCAPALLMCGILIVRGLWFTLTGGAGYFETWKGADFGLVMNMGMWLLLSIIYRGVVMNVFHATEHGSFLVFANAVVAIIAGAGSFLLALFADGVITWAYPASLGLTAFGYVTYKYLYEYLKPVHVKQHAGSRIDQAVADMRADIARKMIPKIKFADIFGNDAIKRRLLEAAKLVMAERNEKTNPRNGILLFGEPGNGKTVFAEALAGELNVPLLQLSYSDVASEWVGEKSKRIRQVFEQARNHAPCVLFIDEVDSFLVAREGAGGRGTKEDDDVVNSLLTLMVDIRRSKVVLMAATNHVDRLDGAGIREGRFDFKVEITPPDAPARIGLLKKGMKDNAPKAIVEPHVIEQVASRWNGFSVKRILAVTEELPSYLVAQAEERGERAAQNPQVGFEDFMGALRAIQGRRGANPENVKPLADMVLSHQTRDMIDQIVGRMADPEHTERFGGTLPTGVLFYGPPGTGKTATCKSIAKELGWAFLPVTGADMARSPEDLEKTYTKAKELRPTIIFIDEADELLKSREFSHSTESTNKLLTLMDGVGDRVRDVVWIAATNNPDMIDPALLRGGRFTDKVVFDLPDEDALRGYLVDWYAQRKVVFEDGLGAEDIAAALGSQSIANAEAVAQSALNRAVSRREPSVVVRTADVEAALKAFFAHG